MKKMFVALVGCFAAFSAFAQDEGATAEASVESSSMEGQVAEQTQETEAQVADASDASGS